jgi:hypothetical protein
MYALVFNFRLKDDIKLSKCLDKLRQGSITEDPILNDIVRCGAPLPMDLSLECDQVCCPTTSLSDDDCVATRPLYRYKNDRTMSCLTTPFIYFLEQTAIAV